MLTLEAALEVSHRPEHLTHGQSQRSCETMRTSAGRSDAFLEIRTIQTIALILV